MDSLKAALAEKRKAQDAGLAQAGSGGTKFVRRGAVRRAQEEEEARRRAEREAEREAQAARRQAELDAAQARFDAARKQRQREERASSTPQRDTDAAAAAAASVGATFQVTDEEAMRRLRARGEPVRLFGESAKERRLRLRALELMEQRGDKVGQNDFMAALGRAEQTETEKTLAKEEHTTQEAHPERVRAKGKDREGASMDSVLDLSLIQTDEAKVYPLIYYFLKGLLQEWADTLAARPDDVRNSVAGKMAAATQVQSETYLKPLFKQLRKRSLPSDMLLRIAEIVHFLQKREYRHANDSYLQLSIGNAPWPIGATSVGIHERSGRERIFSSKIAHVLNDEETRKYIQSLKRVMTFTQSKYPPKDVSMLMG